MSLILHNILITLTLFLVLQDFGNFMLIITINNGQKPYQIYEREQFENVKLIKNKLQKKNRSFCQKFLNTMIN
ncbi:unnamed protein product [Paramecium primaurelia]|uniref:Uncharacterized protein n=1 Tax=Paramecium primaurelia TaxID=5886 RepID=A0A8S1NZD5_PARPR|nr:unnamed protein product [Paramecium primaurelia]